jgi:large subunit ribosomal protein L21
MYAIVKCGGKQYNVSKDSIIRVEKLDGNVGDVVSLEVIMLADENGSVTAGEAVKSASAKAVIETQGKYPKILVCHYKPKKQIRKRQGHRQPYTELKITAINA